MLLLEEEEEAANNVVLNETEETEEQKALRGKFNTQMGSEEMFDEIIIRKRIRLMSNVSNNQY